MFLFEKSLAQRRGDAKTAKYVRYLCVLVLFASFLVLGCKQEPDEPDYKLDEKLVGTWIDSTYFDGYTITTTYLSYGYGAGAISYAGTIRHATAFSSTAGVIIIEYDADHKPTYYDSFDNYGDPDHIVPLKGDFVGIYYKNLKPGESVEVAGAIDPATYTGVEAFTLDAAISKFTVHTVDTYVTMYGGPYTYVPAE